MGDAFNTQYPHMLLKLFIAGSSLLELSHTTVLQNFAGFHPDSVGLIGSECSLVDDFSCQTFQSPVV